MLDDIPGRLPSGRAARKVICRCDCGNIVEVYKQKLLRGHVKSCGCLQKQMRKNFGKRQQLGNGEACFNETYYSYKRGAQKRGYEFALTKDEFYEIIIQPCIYCGESLTQEKIKKSSNGTFRYTGIDRYDNTLGYIKENCVPCCRRCNIIKSDLTIEEMDIHLEKILAHKNIWSNVMPS